MSSFCWCPGLPPVAPLWTCKYSCGSIMLRSRERCCSRSILPELVFWLPSLCWLRWVTGTGYFLDSCFPGYPSFCLSQRHNWKIAKPNHLFRSILFSLPIQLRRTWYKQQISLWRKTTSLFHSWNFPSVYRKLKGQRKKYFWNWRGGVLQRGAKWWRKAGKKKKYGKCTVKFDIKGRTQFQTAETTVLRKNKHSVYFICLCRSYWFIIC